MTVRIRRRDEEDHENPGWPGLVDLFAFGMVIMLVLWVAASKKSVRHQAEAAAARQAASEQDAQLQREVKRVQELRRALTGQNAVIRDGGDQLSFEVSGFDGDEVYFEPAAYTLPQSDRSVIAALGAKVAEKLKEYQGFVVLVNGTADPVPLARELPPRNNVELSALRAAGVSELLLASGIEPCRLQVVGLGSKEVSAEGMTAQDLRRLRRVYLTLRAIPKDAGGRYGDCR
ncbi:hypothetical protein TBR22_A06060 [Luteitalea sp. TBR-22]|uniref:OmpA/MotB family protein n=1 Tax=Luteitalea sp. TBR-22 TaxID=2802971 RepID=UPI001AF7C171|nr:OmpA family protein [Luteitalea sp. TBR-22]BCS31405.1 hypothetical protein TBR22_A06060 [Luteitalea sp. TBR-22]